MSLIVIRYLFNLFVELFNDKSSEEKINTFCHQYGIATGQKEIVEQLNIAEGTIETHIYDIFKRQKLLTLIKSSVRLCTISRFHQIHKHCIFNSLSPITLVIRLFYYLFTTPKYPPHTKDRFTALFA